MAVVKLNLIQVLDRLRSAGGVRETAALRLERRATETQARRFHRRRRIH